MAFFSKIERLAASAAIVLALGAASASAATVTYSSLVTGQDLGSGVQATLTYTQNGTDVDFSLTNTLNSLATAFIGAIGFTYSGIIPTGFTNLVGSQAVVASLGTQSLSGGGLSIDFGAQFNKANGPGRLVNGETALFSIINVDASLFDFSALKTAIHAQGLADGGSTKYTSGVPSPVPLPAAGLLMLAGLGGLTALRRRKKA
jgi:hypothetical protein